MAHRGVRHHYVLYDWTSLPQYAIDNYQQKLRNREKHVKVIPIAIGGVPDAKKAVAGINTPVGHPTSASLLVSAQDGRLQIAPSLAGQSYYSALAALHPKVDGGFQRSSRFFFLVAISAVNNIKLCFFSYICMYADPFHVHSSSFRNVALTWL